VTSKVEEQVLEKPSKPSDKPLMSAETKIKSLEGLLKEMESNAPAPSKKLEFPQTTKAEGSSGKPSLKDFMENARPAAPAKEEEKKAPSGKNALLELLKKKK